jgi:hypothetical protein
LINFIHPEESFFFPNDFFIALVIFIIFISILMVYRHYFKLHQPSKNLISSNKNEKSVDMENTAELGTSDKLPKLDFSDKLTIIGIILTVIFTGIYPFIQKPILDYSVIYDENGNDSKFGIKVINRGFATANDVIISLKSSGDSFKTFTLEPFMNHTVNNSGTKGYVKIDFLSPSSQTILNSELLANSSSVENNDITTYVRSHESTGHYDTLIKIIFYLSLSIIFGFVFIYLSYWHKLGLKKLDNWQILHKREKRSLIYIILIILSYIVIFSVVYHMLNNNYNNINITNENWKLIYYPVLLITFIFIFGISIILFIRQEKSTLTKTNQS